jgi:hypothetical protein
MKGNGRQEKSERRKKEYKQMGKVRVAIEEGGYKEEGMLHSKRKERYRCSRVVASVSFLVRMLEAADNLQKEEMEGGWKNEKKRKEGWMNEGKKSK